MASAKLRVLGGKGRNNKRLELWRNMLIHVEMQLVEGGSQSRVEQDKDRRAGHVSHHHKKQQLLEATQGSLLLTSL